MKTAFTRPKYLKGYYVSFGGERRKVERVHLKFGLYMYMLDDGLLVTEDEIHMCGRKFGPSVPSKTDKDLPF